MNLFGHFPLVICFDLRFIYFDSPVVSDSPKLPLGLINVFEPQSRWFLPNMTVKEDGWIVGPRGELVLWVPNYLMNRLPRAYLVARWAKEPLFRFDVTNFHHGSQWTRCKTT